MKTGYRFGGFTLDLATLSLRHDGVPVELRPKAFDTLRALVERAGEVVTKDELVSIVWPDVTVNDDALSQCIRDIRKALGEDGKDLIRTVPKRGYIFEGPVESVDGPDANERSPRPAKVRMAILAMAAALTLATWLMWPGSGGRQQITIAVLPFATVGPDEAEGWLGEGIAEDIMTELSRFTDLGVIARNSSFRYGTEIDSPKVVGAELGAAYLLQGSVRRLENRIRLAIQLVETDRGRNVWAERFDEPFTEVAMLPGEAAGLIASRLAANVYTDAASEAARSGKNADAFEATLRARHAYYRFTRGDAYEGLDAAEQAITLDPENAQAWEYKARLLLQFFIQPYDDRRGNRAILDEALEAARRAERLDPKGSSAVATLGTLFTWAGEHEVGLQHLRRAVALNPNDSSAHKQLADALGRAGLHAESLAEWEEGNRLDPIFVPLNYALMGRSHLMLGNFERALEMTGDCIELTPNMMPCHIFNALAAEASGDEELAANSVQHILKLSPGFTVGGWLRIVDIRDEATRERLEELAVAAGLAQ